MATEGSNNTVYVDQEVKTTTAIIGSNNVRVDMDGTSTHVIGDEGKRTSDLFACASKHLNFQKRCGHNLVQGASGGNTSALDLQNVNDAVIKNRNVKQTIVGQGSNSQTAAINVKDSKEVRIESKGGVDTIIGNSGSSTASIILEGNSEAHVKQSEKVTVIK